jgi:hypothetical protein
MSDFFRDFNISRGFSSKTFLTENRTVCIKHSDGRVTEHPSISDPWRYITKVKKEMGVENAWIKEE